jgi:hypothetical protein
VALTNTHPWQGIPQQYADLRFALLSQFESVIPAPYYDDAQTKHPTIGIGFNLDEQPVRAAVFTAMGIPVSQWAGWRVTKIR